MEDLPQQIPIFRIEECRLEDAVSTPTDLKSHLGPPRIELFDIFCQMLDPLDDGHVELKAKLSGHRKDTIFQP